MEPASLGIQETPTRLVINQILILEFGVPLPTLASVSFSSFFFFSFYSPPFLFFFLSKEILYCEETAGLCENGGTCTNLVGDTAVCALLLSKVSIALLPSCLPLLLPPLLPPPLQQGLRRSRMVALFFFQQKPPQNQYQCQQQYH